MTKNNGQTEGFLMSLRSGGIPTLLALVLISGPASIPLLGQSNYDGDREPPEVTGEDGSHFVEIVVPLGIDPVGVFQPGPPGPNTIPSGAAFDCAPCFLGYGMD